VLVGKWDNRLTPIDIFDPATGENLHVTAKIRPLWYWRICKVQLFLSIVWRKWEGRLSVRDAWSIACAVYPTRGNDAR